MSDIGGVIFIIGILGLIPTAGKLVHTLIKKDDVEPIEIVLVFVFVMLIIGGVNN